MRRHGFTKVELIVTIVLLVIPIGLVVMAVSFTMAEEEQRE